MQGTEFRVFQAEHVGAIVVPGGASYTRKELDGWQEWARSRGAKGIAWLLVPGRTGGELRGSITKLEPERLQSLPAAAGAKPGDAILFAAGPRRGTLELLGALRNAVARQRGLVREGEWQLLWVVDAPMFEPVSDDNPAVADRARGWTAVHHPVHGPDRGVRRQLPHRPGAGAGARLRRRRQRHGARRRVDPYPPPRDAAAGLRRRSGCRARRRRASSASCSRRSATARRRTAASPSASTGSLRRSSAPTRSAR